MGMRATSVNFLDDVILEMTFQDGKVVRFDMSTMFLKFPQLEELRRDRKLFESGHLDPGGFGVVWNDELDFEAISIYEGGEVVGEVETSINQQIGVLLMKTRKEKNVTQCELARLTNIDQGDISKIERGAGNPTIGKLKKLFSALGKTICFTLK